jgi:hypothetical protein
MIIANSLAASRRRGNRRARAAAKPFNESIGYCVLPWIFCLSRDGVVDMTKAMGLCHALRRRIR